MSTLQVTYVGDLKMECRDASSGARVVTDAPLEKGGDGAHFSPTDLCAAALATCLMTTMARTSQAHAINIDGMHATVEKVMSVEPHRVGALHVHVYVPQHLTEKEQLLLRRAAGTCNMHLTLDPGIEQDIVFHFGV